MNVFQRLARRLRGEPVSVTATTKIPLHATRVFRSAEQLEIEIDRVIADPATTSEAFSRIWASYAAMTQRLSNQ